MFHDSVDLVSMVPDQELRDYATMSFQTRDPLSKRTAKGSSTRLVSGIRNRLMAVQNQRRISKVLPIRYASQRLETVAYHILMSLLVLKGGFLR